jgi:L-alanine-DL-glutamate epimerase-like enolase superfamily enzyme
MIITAIRSHVEHFPLHRPYVIAFRAIDAVDNVILEITTDSGLVGVGAASPEPHVTGENNQTCQSALKASSLDWLLGQDVRELPTLCRELAKRLPTTPAARAAVDMALHDLLAQQLDVPLVVLLGRAHSSLPTSITIGIKSPEETVAEAQEYLGRGFRILKVKLGHDLETDISRLYRLRKCVGSDVKLRVDVNQGYNHDDLLDLLTRTTALNIELVEQPLPTSQTHILRTLPETQRNQLAADESLLTENDALQLIIPPRPYGIFNIKLMKCGGLRPALRIATFAETAGVKLMWGCMDESIISISAALHAALASPATHYLDLDGSFDLARDIVTGGFILENGFLRTTNAPGLGVRGVTCDH